MMVDVYLACTGNNDESPFVTRDYERLRKYAGADEIGRHAIIGNPEGADIVAFVGSSRVHYKDVRESDLYKRYGHKSVVFVSADRPLPTLPGVYVCLEHRFGKLNSAAISGFYLRVTEKDELDLGACVETAEYLYSFVGNAKRHPVRKALLKLHDPRSILRDTSGYSGSSSTYLQSYLDVIRDSKFVLCPRGNGVSSWRLFETMRAGRVPIVISDQWVPTPGPKWSSFSVQIKESDIKGLPDYLRELESSAPEMGANAKREWHEWFGEKRIFDTCVNLMLLAHENRIDAGNPKVRSLLYGYLLEPYYLRHWVLSPMKQYIANRVFDAAARNK